MHYGQDTRRYLILSIQWYILCVFFFQSRETCVKRKKKGWKRGIVCRTAQLLDGLVATLARPPSWCNPLHHWPTVFLFTLFAGCVLGEYGAARTPWKMGTGQGS